VRRETRRSSNPPQGYLTGSRWEVLYVRLRASRLRRYGCAGLKDRSQSSDLTKGRSVKRMDRAANIRRSRGPRPQHVELCCRPLSIYRQLPGRARASQISDDLRNRNQADLSFRVRALQFETMRTPVRRRRELGESEACAVAGPAGRGRFRPNSFSPLAKRSSPGAHGSVVTGASVRTRA
jgi:hypothetical protein